MSIIQISRYHSFPALSLLVGLLFFSCGVSRYSSDSVPVEHDMWDSLLSEHVDESGLVDYEGFLQDSARLDAYLELLGAHHPNEKNWSSDERLAYWINAYNAFTIELILNNWPVSSIKDIKSGITFINSVWDIKFIDIEGRTYDLNNIEHGIIRERFDEPRIHFAINCASISCPKLRGEAYTAEKLDQQLEDQAREFFADEEKNKFISADKAKLSPIFSWFKGDFTKNGSLVEYVNQYAPVKLNLNAEIEKTEYDWALNNQS